MTIKTLKANCQLITHNNKYYFISYDKLCAIMDCINHKLYTIKEYWRYSQTTTKHINEIFKFLNIKITCKDINVKFIKLNDNMIYEVIIVSIDDLHQINEGF